MRSRLFLGALALQAAGEFCFTHCAQLVEPRRWVLAHSNLLNGTACGDHIESFAQHRLAPIPQEAARSVISPWNGSDSQARNQPDGSSGDPSNGRSRPSISLIARPAIPCMSPT